MPNLGFNTTSYLLEDVQEHAKPYNVQLQCLETPGIRTSRHRVIAYRRNQVQHAAVTVDRGAPPPSTAQDDLVRLLRSVQHAREAGSNILGASPVEGRYCPSDVVPPTPTSSVRHLR